MISIENEHLATALKKLNIFIVPKNIAIYNNEGQITELFLSRFGLKEIPKDFFEDPIFSNIEKLYLNSNKLTVIPNNSFKPLKKLKYINLSRNFITRISTNTFPSLQKIIEIDLSNNTLTEIEDQSFKNLKELKIINLKNNALENLSLELFVNLKIKSLNLSINKFRNLPKALSN